MRVLLDECLPRRLKAHFPDHQVMTVPEAGWAGKKNGIGFVAVGGATSAGSSLVDYRDIDHFWRVVDAVATGRRGAG